MNIGCDLRGEPAFHMQKQLIGAVCDRRRRNSVADAEVSFELLNYAELVAISEENRCKREGRAQDGQGSLFVSCGRKIDM